MSKTNIGLVEYCKAQLGRPYWMGTTGQISSEWLYNYLRNRADIARYYTATDFMRQLGLKVHDCIGLIKGYFWSDGPDTACDVDYDICPDLDANTMLYYCAEKGAIGTIPEIPGVLVFFKGHVGVYIGGGQVIEARGHAYGVVQTALNSRPWTNWGKCPYINYVVESEDEKMSYEQFKEYMQKYEEEVRAKPEPAWSKTEGFWAKAVEQGSINGKHPEAPIRRCELVAVLGREGLFDD